MHNLLVCSNDFIDKGLHRKLETLIAVPFIKWKDVINCFN